MPRSWVNIMNRQWSRQLGCRYVPVVFLYLISSCDSNDSKETVSLDNLEPDRALSDLSDEELTAICHDIRSERQNIYRENPDGMCRRIAFHSNLVWEGVSDDLEACNNIVEDCKKEGADYVFIDNCNDERRLNLSCDVTVGYLKSCIETRRQLLRAEVLDANEKNASCELRAEGFEGWPASFYEYSDHPDECEEIYLDDSCGLILGTFDRYADDLG